jgi:signal transduction histidine kinase
VLERLSIRWRLALISSLLTLAILSAFAVVIGEATTRRIRSDFNSQLAATTDKLREQLHLSFQEVGFNQWIVTRVDPKLDVFAVPDKAAIRLVSPSGGVLAQTSRAPDFGYPVTATQTIGDYRVAARSLVLNDSGGFPAGYIWIQYARPLSQLQATVSRVRAFLFFGVLAGAALALAGGLMLARRAMSPITALTRTSRAIATTRDPNRRVPVPRTDDEVAELARTLDEMLIALEASRVETSAALARQRQFVADASHELRTPLTSVLANLEILAETLGGDERDAASSALRSTQRMRRLVGDLLLLARADAQRDVPHAPTDLGRVVVEAAAELGPVAEEHVIEVDAAPAAIVLGARDDLFRLVLNLLQNAVEHTPRGTHIQASVAVAGDEVVVSVADDGPGIDPAVRDRLFERFVRGAGDRGGSTGLGLAIVKAVTEAHGGTVSAEDAHDNLIRRGTRFTVRLPRLESPGADPAGEQAAALDRSL